MQAALLPDRGVVKVAGDDARRFLNGLVTGDMAKVAAGKPCFAALLTPQGKIMVDMIVAEALPEDGGGFFLDCPRALALTLLQRFVSHASSTYFPVLMPVLVLALPILDTATVTVIRLREGRPIYVGDSRHLSHRLVSLGMSPALAVTTIYLMALGIGLGAVGLAHADFVHSLLILVQALAVVAVVLVLLFYDRRVQTRADGP